MVTDRLDRLAASAPGAAAPPAHGGAAPASVPASGTAAEGPAASAKAVHPRCHRKQTNRRPVLQANDVCDEQDSETLTKRREQIEEFRQHVTARNVLTMWTMCVYRAILHSTGALSLHS